MLTPDDVIDTVRHQWRDVLGVPQSEPEDDFFELGGTSLMAVTLLERVEESLSITFPIEALFLEGTLGAVEQACVAAAFPAAA